MKNTKGILILFGLFALPLLIVVVSYLLWPYWVTNVIKVILPDSGIRFVQGDFSRPGFTSMHITNLELVYRIEGNEFGVQVDSLDIDYNLESLFKGELVAIRSDRVDVQHQQVPLTGSDTKSTVRGFPLVMPEELFKRVPLKILNIQDLAVTSSHLSDYGKLTGHLAYNSREVELGLSSEGLVKLETYFMASNDNKVVVSLKQAGESVAAISSQIEQQGNLNKLAASARINLDRATRIAKSVGWLNVEFSASGYLDAQWQLPLPNNINGENLPNLEVTGEIISSGKLNHENEKVAADYHLQATFKGNRRKMVADLDQLDIIGALPLEDDTLAALPAVKKQCLENPECAQFLIKMSPKSELVFEPDPLSLSLSKGIIDVSLGINHDVIKKNFDNVSEPGLVSHSRLTKLDFLIAEDWRVNSKFDSRLLIDSLVLPELKTGKIAAKVTGHFGADSNQLRVKIDDNAQIDIQQLNVSDGRIPSLSIGNSNEIEMLITNEIVEVSRVKFDLNAPEFSWDNQAYRLQGGEAVFKRLSIDLNNSFINQVDADVVLLDIDINKPGLKLTPISLSTNVTLKGHTLSGYHQLRDRTGIIQVNGQYQHDLQNSRGTSESVLHPIAFSEDKTFLPKFIRGWKTPLDLSAGKVSATAAFSWQKDQLMSKTAISIKDVGGFYDRNLFTGMNGLIELAGSSNDLEVPRQTLSVATVNTGVVIKNIEFQVHGTLEELYIENFQAALLGGKVSQKSMTLRPNDPDIRMNLQLENIQLSELLKLQPGVVGEGVLNGQLPIRLYANGIKMEQGKINAVNTGIIRYQSKVPVSKAVSDAGVKLALDALENFHYNVLDVIADYAETGELLLKVTLQGRNPDLKVQRPFHFNLKVRQNIPALLKSLQLTQQISDSIDKRVKNFYTERP